MASIAQFLDKAYEQMEFAELADAPVDALQGVSAADAEALKKAFNIKTIRDLANNKFVLVAQAIVTTGGPVAANLVDKAHEGTSGPALVDAPVSALQGVSDADGEALKKAFNIKTIRDLANNKFVRVAQAITTLAGPAKS